MADTANAPVPTTPQIQQTRSKKFVWAMSGVSTGKPVRVSDWPDKTFQMVGGASWGGATMVLEGSNDPTADPDNAAYATSVWATLTDTTETPISATADTTVGVVQVLQNPEWIRPKSTGGTGTVVKALLIVGKQ